MIKDFKSLEIKIGEKVYTFLCSIDSPLGEVHDVLHQMKSYVVGVINKIHETEKAPESQPEVKAE